METTINKVSFKGVEYLVRVLPTGEQIGSELLQAVLAADNYEGEAELIDNTIAGYIDIKDLTQSDEVLTELCRESGIIE